MTMSSMPVAQKLTAGRALCRLFPVAWGAALSAFLLVAAYVLGRGDASPVWLTAAVLVLCGGLWTVPAADAPMRRPPISLFLLAFGLRVAAAVFFDAHANAGGDPFAGSPDAWSYDFWARRLVSAWTAWRDLDLHVYGAAGRWDVGYHYLLGGVYAVFGESVLTGRIVGALFGALAVVFLFLIARRVSDERSAVIAGLLYALWISSVVWATYSVLRDSVVWALLLASVWLVLRVVDGSRLAVFGFFLSLVGLRTIRPYAAFLVVFGLAVAGLFALIARLRAAVRPAIALAGAVLVAEAVFLLSGFPGVGGMVTAYAPRRILLNPMKEASREEVLAQREALARSAEPWNGDEDLMSAAAVPRPRAAQDGAAPAPQPLLGQSLPANVVRFILSPPAWAPVSYGSGNIDNWHLPGMWLWYAILPAATLGGFLLLGAGNAGRTLVVGGAAICLALILMGRGDAARQREMVVPLVLLSFSMGVRAPARQRRSLIVAYIIYFAILSAGILYHRETLRARGLAGVTIRSHDASGSTRSLS